MSIPQEDKKKKKESNKPKNYTWEFIIWCVIVFFIWLAYLFAHEITPDIIIDSLPDKFRDNKGAFEIGTFGDYFGALNALFAGLAFAGLIVTIRQQSKDLQATKDEMQNQTSQFKEQNQQAKIAQISEDIYNRLSLIKQIEREVEILSWENEEKTILKGAHAIEELGNKIIAITSKLFPDEEDPKHAINITSITNDCLSYACSFQYLDAWLNSICLLLDDVDKSFNIVEDEKERDALKYRYWRVILKSSNMSLIPILYANHDTHLQYPIVEHLRRIKVIEERTLSQSLLSPKKRSLLYSILSNFSVECPDDIVYDIGNQWRIHKGWPPFCAMMKAQAISSPNSYNCSIEELKNNPSIRQQIRKELIDLYPCATICSANSQEAACVVFTEFKRASNDSGKNG